LGSTPKTTSDFSPHTFPAGLSFSITADVFFKFVTFTELYFLALFSASLSLFVIALPTVAAIDELFFSCAFGCFFLVFPDFSPFFSERCSEF
jgi:hypothetical protein